MDRYFVPEFSQQPDGTIRSVLNGSANEFSTLTAAQEHAHKMADRYPNRFYPIEDGGMVLDCVKGSEVA